MGTKMLASALERDGRTSLQRGETLLDWRMGKQTKCISISGPALDLLLCHILYNEPSWQDLSFGADKKKRNSNKSTQFRKHKCLIGGMPWVSSD